MVAQSESQSPALPADATETSMRAGSTTPKAKVKSRKPFVKGAVTSTLSHNTRYATRLRTGTQALNAAADTDYPDGPATPITMVRIAPKTSSVDEAPRQQGLPLAPLADKPPRKEASHCGIIALSEPLLLEQGVSAITAPALPVHQATRVSAYPVQTALAAGSSSSNTGESLLSSHCLFYGVLNGSNGFRRPRTTGPCSAP